jgi:uncharacterized protein YbjT (DUF2867 family)
MNVMDETRPILVLGGTGKTGRRVVDRLNARGIPVRVGSRAGRPRFDWDDPATWTPVVEGVRAVYVPYPDLIMPEATKATREFAEHAVDQGVTRIVLLTGRGEDEAQRAEREVQELDVDVTIVRCAWFMQIFSEDYLLDEIRAGRVTIPAGDTQLDPFIDADDIADVAVASLTESGHAGQVYELTSRQLLSFPDAIDEIARAIGREITFEPVSVEDYADRARQQGVPASYTAILKDLFSSILGNSAYLTDGVSRSLGRAPRSFSEYASRTAAAGIWTQAATR